MKIAQVQINPWEKELYFIVDSLEVKVGDYVVVETSSAMEIAKILELKEGESKDFEAISIEEKPIIRKADLKDLEKLEHYEKNKTETIDYCKKLIEKHKLPMKLVDVHFSFDDNRLSFAFIADGRVDFRALVKDLTRQYQKSIRLQQLGVRDEAQINGDIGACGISQCCKTHLKVLGNVNAEQAELQQISHRGAERLSGICNRLKCCLRYENDLYEELSSKLPEIGSKVKTPRGKGEVIEYYTLKQTVRVKLEADENAVIEVPLSEIN